MSWNLPLGKRNLQTFKNLNNLQWSGKKIPPEKCMLLINNYKKCFFFYFSLLITVCKLEKTLSEDILEIMQKIKGCQKWWAGLACYSTAVQQFILQPGFTIFLLFRRGAEAPEGPLVTALLLSLSGVSCLVFNQWHSSFHQNIQQMDKVLDSRCFIIKVHTLKIQNMRFHQLNR